MKTALAKITVFSAIALCAVPLNAAVWVQFDLSSYYNYDGVGTQNEISAVAGDTPITGTADTLSEHLGDHNIINNLAFANQASVPGGQTALPNDGILVVGGESKYQLSTAYDNGTDYLTKSNNVLRIVANNTTPTQIQTITLAPGDQGQYQSFNLAMTVQRAASASTYSSQITVSYSDATTAVVMLTNDGVGDVPRGTFGSNNFGLTSDAYTFTNEAPGTGETVSFSNVLASTYYQGLSGSSPSQVTSIRSGTASIFEFGSDIPLDSSKVLQSIEIQLTRGGSNRDNNLFVWGISAQAIPEPGSVSLLACGGLLLLLLRRRWLTE